MPVEVTCLVCGTIKSVPPSDAAKRRTCSNRCAAALRGGGTRERECQWCGKVETVRASKADRPYCSLACYGAAQTKGLRRSPTHGSWRAMIRRCTDPTNKRWKYYGGRGVTVCDEWLASFDAFLADMGERPEGKTLDRIDPNGNYEPGNCRWATAVEQRHNRRDSRDWPEIERTLRAPARPTESTPA